MPDNTSRGANAVHDETARDSGELTLLGLANMILAQRRLVIGLPVGLMVLVGLFTIASPRLHSATSIISPALNDASRLTGIAAQLGISVPSSGGESIDFYRQLLTSQELLLKTAATPFEFNHGDKKMSGTVADLYEVEGDNPNERTRALLKLMRGLVVTGKDIDSNTIHLRTMSEWPQLAILLNHRLLELLEEFNGERRRSRAGEERRFIEGRLGQARSDLAAAEAELEQFLAKNRSYGNSPELVLQEARLQRSIGLAQQVYVMLSQAYEQARIDEVRNTSVTTVVSRPQVTEPVGRGTTVRALVAFLFGVFLAAIIAFARYNVQEQRAMRPNEYERYLNLRRRTPGIVRFFLPTGSNHPHRADTTLTGKE